MLRCQCVYFWNRFWRQAIKDFSEISSLYTATGKLNLIEHKADDGVIEVAIAGGCNYLVTGDRKHLLPLKTVDLLKIISPATFLDLLN